MWDASTVWLDEQCIGPMSRIQTCEPQAAEVEHMNLTTVLPGQPNHFILKVHLWTK